MAWVNELSMKRCKFVNVLCADMEQESWLLCDSARKEYGGAKNMRKHHFLPMLPQGTEVIDVKGDFLAGERFPSF